MPMPEINTKQQWQDAVDEFGDRAFERFFVNHGEGSFEHSSNDEAIEYLNQLNQITLPYLFVHDISVYGDKAFLMWEWQYKDNGIDKWIDQWKTCDKPLSFKETLNYRRKISAELPFDLERAKAGDAIERLNDKEWHPCFFVSHHKNEIIVLQFGYEIAIFHDYNWQKRLRMKYLPKLENQK